MGVGSCVTGDCGGKLQCDGIGATPPASLFEITLGTGDQKDFYDVSIVDGYNLPLVAAPRGVYGECNATGCVADINMGCPKELQVIGSDEREGGVVACKSACEAFGLDQYCCSGEFANPTTCRPSFYSGIFKNACPRAYSYAFDDGTSTFTCKASEYDIIFCPNSGMRRIDGGLQAPEVGESRSGKTAATASSSTILLPFPVSIFVLLFTLYLWHTWYILTPLFLQSGTAREITMQSTRGIYLSRQEKGKLSLLPRTCCTIRMYGQGVQGWLKLLKEYITCIFKTSYNNIIEFFNMSFFC